jgi:hypothetical protein
MRKSLLLLVILLSCIERALASETCNACDSGGGGNKNSPNKKKKNKTHESCDVWEGISLTNNSAVSKCNRKALNERCVGQLNKCADFSLQKFAEGCYLTPPCPSTLSASTLEDGTPVCAQKDVCTNTNICGDSSDCVNHYGGYSCESYDVIDIAEQCEAYNLCGSNFIDGEVEAIQLYNDLSVAKPEYQLSECKMNSAQQWQLSFQFPLHDKSPGLYFTQSTQPTFDSVEQSDQCFLDLEELLPVTDGSLPWEFSGNANIAGGTFFVNSLKLTEAPLSGQDFSAIEHWDQNTIQKWVHGTIHVSLPKLHDLCGWSHNSLDTSIFRAIVTAHYVENKFNIQVGKTCDFNVVSEGTVSNSNSAVVGLSLNSWLKQYRPSAEYFGRPFFFYENDGQSVGMEISILLTYRNINPLQTIGPVDVSSVVFPALSERCYAPHVTKIRTGFFGNDVGAFCEADECKYVIVLRTGAVSTESSVDFSKCVLDPAEHTNFQFTVLAQQCGRQDLGDCDFVPAAQIRADVGETINIALSGVAKKYLLKYKFGAFTSYHQTMTVQRLLQATCYPLCLPEESPWFDLDKGDIDDDVCVSEEKSVEQNIDQSANVCTYVYVKDMGLVLKKPHVNELNLEIIWDSVVVRPIGLTKENLPSFSFSEIHSRQENVQNHILTTEERHTHSQILSMKNVDSSEFSGVAGFCWDQLRFLYFYSSLYKNKIKPFRKVYVDMDVRYTNHLQSSPTHMRNLLETTTDDTEHVTVEMEFGSLNYMLYNETTSKITSSPFSQTTDIYSPEKHHVPGLVKKVYEKNTLYYFLIVIILISGGVCVYAHKSKKHNSTSVFRRRPYF